MAKIHFRHVFGDWEEICLWWSRRTEIPQDVPYDYVIAVAYKLLQGTSGLEVELCVTTIL